MSVYEINLIYEFNLVSTDTISIINIYIVSGSIKNTSVTNTSVKFFLIRLRLSVRSSKGFPSKPLPPLLPLEPRTSWSYRRLDLDLLYHFPSLNRYLYYLNRFSGPSFNYNRYLSDFFYNTCKA